MPRRARTTDPDAAALIGQPSSGLEADPEPAPPARRRRTPGSNVGNQGKVRARNAKGQIMSKTAMIAKVEEELYLYFSLFVGAWELRDPDCASVMYSPASIPGTKDQVERMALVVQRVTSLIARSDSLLEKAANTGIIGEIALLCHALWPVGKAIYRAHGPGGMGHQQVEEDPRVLAARYPAYQPAA